jgi:hypothetical protein
MPALDLGGPTVRGPDADALARYFLYGIIVLILLAIVPFLLKRIKRQLEADEFPNEHELLTQFSAARDAGVMDSEEYEQVKAAMIRKAKAEEAASDPSPAPPPIAAGPMPEAAAPDPASPSPLRGDAGDDPGTPRGPS